MFKRLFPNQRGAKLGGLIFAVLLACPVPAQAGPGGFGSGGSWGSAGGGSPAARSKGGEQQRSFSTRDGYRARDHGSYQAQGERRDYRAPRYEDRRHDDRRYDERGHDEHRFGDHRGDRDVRRGDRGFYRGGWGYAVPGIRGYGPHGYAGGAWGGPSWAGSWGRFGPAYGAFRAAYRGWGWAGVVTALPRYPVYNGWGWARPVGPVPGYRYDGYRGGYRGGLNGWGHRDPYAHGPYPRRPDRR